jgi:hypothetical protein
VIPEFLRHILTFSLERLLDRRLATDASSRGTQVDGQELWRLGYSGWHRGTWSIMTVVWATALGFGGWLWARGELEGRLAPALLLCAGFLVFAVLTVRDAYVQQLSVSAWGITERRCGRVTGACAWSDIARVRFLWYLDAYEVLPREGPSLRFSMQIRGLACFKALALRHAPPQALRGVADRLQDPSRR